MNHLIRIQNEFVKYAIDFYATTFDDMSRLQQERYVNDHPATGKVVNKPYHELEKRFVSQNNAEKKITKTISEIFNSLDENSQSEFLSKVKMIQSMMKDDVTDYNRKIRDDLSNGLNTSIKKFNEIKNKAVKSTNANKKRNLLRHAMGQRKIVDKFHELLNQQKRFFKSKEPDFDLDFLEKVQGLDNNEGKITPDANDKLMNVINEWGEHLPKVFDSNKYKRILGGK